MDRRKHFLRPGTSIHLERLSSATVSSFADVNQATTNGNARQPVLVRSGFTRTSDGTDERAPSPSGCSTSRSFVGPIPRGGLPSLCFLRESSPISRRSSSRASRAGSVALRLGGRVPLPRSRRQAHAPETWRFLADADEIATPLECGAGTALRRHSSLFARRLDGGGLVARCTRHRS